jgi:hypothetical protein
MILIIIVKLKSPSIPNFSKPPPPKVVALESPIWALKIYSSNIFGRASMLEFLKTKHFRKSPPAKLVIFFL